jgi:hypothetical protein
MRRRYCQFFLSSIQLHLVSRYRSCCMVLFILPTVVHVLKFSSCLSLMPYFNMLQFEQEEEDAKKILSILPFFNRVVYVLRFFSCPSLMPRFDTFTLLRFEEEEEKEEMRRRYCQFFLSSIQLHLVSRYRSCYMVHFILPTVVHVLA